MTAVKPNNPLIRIAQPNVNLPSTGGPNKKEPRQTLQNIGYDNNTNFYAEEGNYIFDNIGQWVQYLIDAVDGLQVQIEKERVSIGEIIEITGDSTNPAVLKGYGTWEAFGQGRVTVGVGSFQDDRGENKTWVDGQEEGEYRHVQTSSELASHSHGTSVSSNTHSHEIKHYRSSDDVGDGISGAPTSTQVSTETETDTHTHTVTVNPTGSSSPMNNIQPSVAVYRWKRTA